MKNIKTPIFIIALDDSTVEFLHETWEVDCCDIESSDVANGEYIAYDSEGQILKLATINEKGEIESPTENIINIPFLGKIVSVINDKTITAIPTGIKDPAKLIEYLVRDLCIKHDVDSLTLPELVQIYKDENPKKDFGD